MSTKFADLGLPARLVEALAADGMTEAFPVQAITLPDALAGKDLCGRAPTGSGKTLGFGIPMMVRISQAEPTKPTGLVLVPTRELAEQVQRAFVPLGRAQWRFIQAIYGGASFGPQIHSLRKGASVVVATPGRLLDIIEKGYCDLSAVEVCVIDEADRMADLGFMPDVRKILDMTPHTRQTMLWSATLDGDVNEIIRDYMNDPVRHDLMGDVEEAEVDHKFVVTRPTDRLDSAVALIEEHGPTIVFVKTRFGVDDVSEDLNRAGVKAGALHGARSQAVRQRVLDDFKRGKLQALVATDVAARGIHVDNVSLVLHYDMPDNDKDYTHRSGRTGRAGNAGLVIAFVPPSRQRLAEKMSDAVGNEVTWERGEKPVERVPAAERETGNRDRGDRERNDRNNDRGGYRGNNDRPSYGDRSRNGRPSYGDRAGNDRASRSDRPVYGDRRPSNARPSYTDRPARNDRPAASDRPAYGARAGGDRPAYADRPNRPERPSYGTDRGQNNWTPRPPRADAPPRDRNDWSPRPRRDDDRGTSGGRFGRDDRPADGARPGPPARNDRAPFNRDAPRTGGDKPWQRRDAGAPGDRPRYGRDDRASTGGYKGRDDRPSTGGYKGRDDRPSTGGYKGRDDRPSTGAYGKPKSRPGAGGHSPAGARATGAAPRSSGVKPTTARPGAVRGGFRAAPSGRQRG